MAGAFIGGLRGEVFVITQRMWVHGEGVQPGVVGQGHCEGWGLAAGLRVPVDEVAHGAEVGGVFG
ncbi:MAG: hypothetical protein M3461_01565 [Pseudomonadota bacterium]|nr:hypothetical protein [Pseudomonadota bacterium]